MDPLIAPGQPAPDFTLPGLDGQPQSLSSLRGRLAILNFWSAECPWSERTDRALLTYLQAWAGEAELLPIAANANEPPDLLARVAAARGLPRVLLDAGGRVAGRYGAQTTPHLFVVDREGILRYQGAFDDVTFRRRQPTQDYLRQAVEALLAGRRPDPAQTPPYGCAIVRHLP
jgi:peroxiredoxin